MFVTRVGAKPLARRKPKARRTCEHPSLAINLQPLIDTFLSPPCGASGAYLFKWEYQSQMLLSKYTDSTTVSPADRREAAIQKMLATEDRCREINNNGYDEHILPSWFNGVFHFASAFVADVLGHVNYDMFRHARFSGGASTSRTRRHGDPFYKYSRVPCDVTPAALPYGVALIKCTPLWYASLNGSMPNITTGNRITTVPKSSDIDRCIAMEPDLNMALQLAVGRHIRKRLLRVGIDLSRQETNQDLARIGSATNELSTIDLSSASDSISYRLVMDLLPYSWFDLLDKLRSPRGVLPNGETVVWEKFSSMGNGYTFELETLIFAALLYGCNKMAGLRTDFGTTDSVYGDDIICRSTVSANLISVLACVGFKTNTSKTFTSGPFRESCGKHYYEGVDVSPFYIREPVITVFDRCRLANRLRQWAYSKSADICDDAVYPIWKYYVKQIPRRLLGGVDLDRIDYVVSPHRRGDIAVQRIDTRPINGYRAILRYFQSTNDTGVLDFTDILSIKCSSRGNDYLTLLPRARVMYERNDEWWRQIPRFSCEVVALGVLT